MITKVILGDGTVLNNIDDIQETFQHNGSYILYGLTLNIIKNKSGDLIDLTELEDIFSKENIFNTIKIYKRDVIEVEENEETGEYEEKYGDEYLALETSKYTGVQSIYKHIESDRISISLTADPTKIADDKYNTLINENQTLVQSIAELTAMIAMLQTP